jgi:hypothetical protein
MDELDPFPDPLESIDGIVASIASGRPHTAAFDAMDAPDGWARPATGASWALDGLLPPAALVPPSRHDGSRRRAAELMQ